MRNGCLRQKNNNNHNDNDNNNNNTLSFFIALYIYTHTLMRHPQSVLWLADNYIDVTLGSFLCFFCSSLQPCWGDLRVRGGAVRAWESSRWGLGTSRVVVSMLSMLRRQGHKNRTTAHWQTSSYCMQFCPAVNLMSCCVLMFSQKYWYPSVTNPQKEQQTKD